LLEFDASANELTNGVINAAFMLLFKDLIRLFACYNDGIINLLEKFFDMKKNQCKEGLELYKKFLTRTSKVSDLLKVAEQVGIDKGEIPDLTKAPSSLLEALESHIASLEGKKVVGSSTGKAGVSSSGSSNLLSNVDEQEKKKALAEEEETLKAFAANKSPSSSSVASPASVQPAAAPASYSSDLSFGFSFDPFDQGSSSSTVQQPTASLSNSLFDPLPTTQQPVQPVMQPQHSFMSAPPAAAPTNNFANFQNFQPQQPAVTEANLLWGTDPANDLFGASDVLQPTQTSPQQQQQQITQTTSINGSNLDASLASIVANLNVSGQANQKFNSTENKLTGGSNYKVGMAAMTTSNTQPMVNPMMATQQPMYNNPYGQQPIMNMGYMQPQQQQMFTPMMQQPQQQTRPLNPNNPFGAMMKF